MHVLVPSDLSGGPSTTTSKPWTVCGKSVPPPDDLKYMLVVKSKSVPTGKDDVISVGIGDGIFKRLARLLSINYDVTYCLLAFIFM